MKPDSSFSQEIVSLSVFVCAWVDGGGFAGFVLGILQDVNLVEGNELLTL